MMSLPTVHVRSYVRSQQIMSCHIPPHLLTITHSQIRKYFCSVRVKSPDRSHRSIIHASSLGGAIISTVSVVHTSRYRQLIVRCPS